MTHKELVVLCFTITICFMLSVVVTSMVIGGLVYGRPVNREGALPVLENLVFTILGIISGSFGTAAASRMIKDEPPKE